MYGLVFCSGACNCNTHNQCPPSGETLGNLTIPLILSILQNDATWIPELVSQGYCNPLYIPSIFAQSILASISDPLFHKTVIDHDLLAMANDSPAILLVASCNDWLTLLNFVDVSPSTLIEKLKKLTSFLHVMEQFDAKEMESFKTLLSLPRN